MPQASLQQVAADFPEALEWFDWACPGFAAADDLTFEIEQTREVRSGNTFVELWAIRPDSGVFPYRRAVKWHPKPGVWVRGSEYFSPYPRAASLYEVCVPSWYEPVVMTLVFQGPVGALVEILTAPEDFDDYRWLTTTRRIHRIGDIGDVGVVGGVVVFVPTGHYLKILPHNDQNLVALVAQHVQRMEKP